MNLLFINLGLQIKDIVPVFKKRKKKKKTLEDYHEKIEVKSDTRRKRDQIHCTTNNFSL